MKISLTWFAGLSERRQSANTHFRGSGKLLQLSSGAKLVSLAQCERRELFLRSAVCTLMHMEIFSPLIGITGRVWIVMQTVARVTPPTLRSLASCQYERSLRGFGKLCVAHFLCVCISEATTFPATSRSVLSFSLSFPTFPFSLRGSIYKRVGEGARK